MQIDQQDRIGGPVRHRRRWPMFIMFTILAGICAGLMIFNRDLEAYFNYGERAAAGLIGGKTDDTKFATLYQRLGMQPLDVKLAYRDSILTPLNQLHDEFCDKQAIYNLSVALSQNGARRAAADALVGFAKECHNAEGELYEAADTYFGLSDFTKTIEITDQLIAHDAYIGQVHYLRGQALEALERWPEALESYVSAIALFGNPARINSQVFFGLANIYSHMGRYCEAITPIQTWVLVNPTERDTTQTRKMIDDFSRQGNCDSDYAKGAETFPRPVNGIIRVRAEINNTPGYFLVDTGASFVTVSEDFAKRANITLAPSSPLQMFTANGKILVSPGSAVDIKLGHALANKVAVVVQQKQVEEGIDGLLGMSFLARFNVVLSERELKLQPKNGN